MRLHCIELPVPSLDEAGRWLESVLHFLPVDDGRLYVCGNFRLRLVTAEGDAPSRAPDKIVGLEHIALETPDAGALLRALLSKGLELEHDSRRCRNSVPNTTLKSCLLKVRLKFT